MAKVLVFNNFFSSARTSVYTSLEESNAHRYTLARPGVFRANPYSKRKHIGIADFSKRVLATLALSIRSLFYDVLIVDSAITAALVSFWLWFVPWPRLIVAHWNVPRRREGYCRQLWRFLYRRVDVFVVHSRFDIRLSSQLLNRPSDSFVFDPYQRESPQTRLVQNTTVKVPEEPYICSIGGNARDYRVLCDAVSTLDIRLVIVARQYNMSDIEPPGNTTVICNIPLDVCDYIASKALFSVLPFDGTEPSCGQITVVTSFMLGRPVICSKSEGMHDYVTGGVNGLYVPMHDVSALREAIWSLWSDRSLLSKLAKGAEEWASEYACPAAFQQRMDALVSRVIG